MAQGDAKMKKTSPPDPAFESRIRSSFDQQGLMKTIGAHLVKVAPGEVAIELPYQQGLHPAAWVHPCGNPEHHRGQLPAGMPPTP